MSIRRKFPASPVIWLTTLGGLSLFLLAFAYVTVNALEDSWRIGHQTVSGIAKLAEQALSREIELCNLSLEAVANGVLDADVMAQKPFIRDRILFDHPSTAGALSDVLVTDREGSIILDSASRGHPRSGNLSDRDFFIVHAVGNGADSLYISKPFKARPEGNVWTLALSRRISNVDGTFRGVVSALIKVDYLGAILKNASVGSDGIVAILRDDGALIARSVFNERLLALNWGASEAHIRARSASEGSFVKKGLYDGRERLFAYRKIAGTRLLISSGMSVDQILGPWISRTVATSMIIFVLVICVVLLVFKLNYELARRAEAERSANALARIDGLTGIANRRMFDETLVRELGRASRNGGCVSLFMLDVDWFKRYNDCYGHSRGDQVLVRIAQSLTDATRKDVDLVARFGGEEFAIILVHKDASELNAIIQRVFKHVETPAIPFPESPFGHVTVSCGIASCPEARPDHATSLIELADKGLYAAKQQGRNQFFPQQLGEVTRPGPMHPQCKTKPYHGDPVPVAESV